MRNYTNPFLSVDKLLAAMGGNSEPNYKSRWGLENYSLKLLFAACFNLLYAKADSLKNTRETAFSYHASN